jgi:hypothetical protein
MHRKGAVYCMYLLPFAQYDMYLLSFALLALWRSMHAAGRMARSSLCTGKPINVLLMGKLGEMGVRTQAATCILFCIT